MTSYFVPGFVVGYVLGVASMCGLVGLCLLHRPRYVAPPMRRRRSLPSVKQEPPTMPVCKPAREDGVNYSFMGTTGLEE